MHDRGDTLVVVAEANAVSGADAALLFTTKTTLLVPGGAARPDATNAYKNTRPGPQRAPDHRVTYATDGIDPLIFGLLAADYPSHDVASGPAHAPLLHRQCVFGACGRALLHSLCGGEATWFRHIAGTFASDVHCGERLSVAIWDTDTGEATFTASVGQRLVIDEGYFRYVA
jgi:hypothetical protein